MIVDKYKLIMQREEAHRYKWATGLSITLSVFIFAGFAFYKGYFDLGSGEIVKIKNTDQVATVIAADKAPSPFENSKKTFKAAFKEIDDQYKQFKDSMAAVLVPFVTSIDVYERE